MKFKTTISRWANFYFFIQNLSEWHYSCRKKYNESWRAELGYFSKEEEESLLELKEIRLRYSETRSLFEKSFFLAGDPFERLEKDLRRDEYDSIKKAFELFINKFDFIYKKDLSFLEYWKLEIERALNNKQINNQIIDLLCILFNTTLRENGKTEIYLLLSAETYTGGGANISKNAITLEISRYPQDTASQALGIIWHEFIHLYFQEEYLNKLLLRHVRIDSGNFYLIAELIIGSLFPRGILGARLLKTKSVVKLLPQISSNQTRDLLDLSREYIDQKKYFDDDYIKKILEILEKKRVTFLK